MNKFINFWQHIPYFTSPYLIEFGWLKIRYYSLMYIVALGIFYFLAMRRLKTENKFNHYSKELLNDYIFWIFLGILIGGRLGYVLFYDLNHFLTNPLEIFMPFDFSNGFKFTGISGMSYHGGILGVGIASLIFCRIKKIKFFELADFVIPCIPLGYTFGRIGNFLNGELFGRITNVKWGMYFPLDINNSLRHPSQLYEAFFEGLILFLILWNIKKLKIFEGKMFSLYLFGYGFIRYFIEFYREPDSHLGLFGGFISMGQILCLIMMIIGLLSFCFKKYTFNKL